MYVCIYIEQLSFNMEYPFICHYFQVHSDSECNIMAKGFMFMPLSLVRLRTFWLSTWVS